MLAKLGTLQAIDRTGVVLIVRLADPEEAVAVASAAVEGGIEVVEVPLTTPHALGAVELLATRFPDARVGAGTVLDGHAAYAAIGAGARFLVSPQLNLEMLATANRYQVPTISGALTPTEILATAEAGADIVKVFPTEAISAAYVRSVLAPLAHIPLLPSGGVTPENVHEWFAAGVAAVGVGGYVTKAARREDGTSQVTRAARRFLAAVAEARQATA